MQEVYNPWGTNPSGWALGDYNGHQVYGLFTANAAFLSQNFASQSFDFGTESGTGGHGNGMHVVADVFFALERHELKRWA